MTKEKSEEIMEIKRDHNFIFSFTFEAKFYHLAQRIESVEFHAKPLSNEQSLALRLTFIVGSTLNKFY